MAMCMPDSGRIKIYCSAKDGFCFSKYARYQADEIQHSLF
jgi:hypothetical protein